MADTIQTHISYIVYFSSDKLAIKKQESEGTGMMHTVGSNKFGHLTFANYMAVCPEVFHSMTKCSLAGG